jgi:hypothetical protein
MTAIRFFTDEDVDGATARALRAAGFDADQRPLAGGKPDAAREDDDNRDGEMRLPVCGLRFESLSLEP